MSVSTAPSRRPAAYLGYHLGRFPEIGAALHRVGFGQVVLDQPQPDVVAHLVQLLVHLDIVAIEVLAQLRYNCAVRERHELGVDLVYACPRPVRNSPGDIVGRNGSLAHFQILQQRSARHSTASCKGEGQRQETRTLRPRGQLLWQTWLVGNSLPLYWDYGVTSIGI